MSEYHEESVPEDHIGEDWRSDSGTHRNRDYSLHHCDVPQVATSTVGERLAERYNRPFPAARVDILGSETIP